MKHRGPDSLFPPPSVALALKIVVDPHPLIVFPTCHIPTCVSAHHQTHLFIFYTVTEVVIIPFFLLSIFQTHYTVPDTEKDLQSLIATIECEQPQPDLYKYELLCAVTHAGTSPVHQVPFLSC